MPFSFLLFCPSPLHEKLDGAIVATRYVYQLRGEKREARMPKHIRLQSDLGPPMPGIVRYTDASGATVYSSQPYQLMKDHARGGSAYSLANSDFEEGFDDPASAGLYDTEDNEAQALRTGYEAHDRNAPEGGFSTVQRDVSDIEA